MEKLKITTESAYRIGFWFLVIYLAGIISGIFFTQDILIGRRLNEATKLGGMVISNEVYDVKKRL